ncbi:hypothetical protein GCM10011517_03060 [Actibacterium pelagium]|uniref:Uncharacterized protein n=1 Tax=Actibacterium pelagium TaxID=2029103 RepID=A0A917AB01_9RHOB|nr:hypothetical protein GCM10011517_03060 [Actibacterium pelagium]
MLSEVAHSNKERLSDTDEKFLLAHMLRHKGKAVESFEALKLANASKLDRNELESWRQECRAISEVVANWLPSEFNEPLPNRVKFLFVLGPSRSGKSTLEALLGLSKEVSLGFEAWKDSEAKKYLKQLASNELEVMGTTAEANIEEVLFTNRQALEAEKKSLRICTNPMIIEVAHLLFGAFDNAYFLFVRRDETENASEVFATDYKSKRLPFSYDAEASMEYVQWYNSLTTDLCGKMGSRARMIRFEERIADPGKLEDEFADWLGVKFEASGGFASGLEKRRAGDYIQQFRELLSADRAL